MKFLSLSQVVATPTLWVDKADQPLFSLSLSRRVTSYVDVFSAQVSQQDQVRCLSASSQSPWLLASGCYDGSARLHDSRCSASSSSALVRLPHESPVEAVQFSPNDGLLYTAAGTWVTAWSLAQPTRPVSSFRRHHKTVTRLALARGGSRLLSAGLDGLVKVTDTLSYAEVAQMEYHRAAILSLALAPDNSSLALGTVDRWLHRRRRQQAPVAPAAQTDSYLDKVGVLGLTARLEDVIQPHVARPYRLERHERLLRRFRHSDALAQVLDRPVAQLCIDKVCAVLRELVLRNGLKPALAGQPPRQSVKLVNLVRRHLFDNDRAELLLTVAEQLLEVFLLQSNAGGAIVVREHPALWTALKRLAGFLNMELTFLNNVQRTLGELDLVLGEISVFSNM